MQVSIPILQLYINWVGVKIEQGHKIARRVTFPRNFFARRVNIAQRHLGGLKLIFFMLIFFVLDSVFY